MKKALFIFLILLFIPAASEAVQSLITLSFRHEGLSFKKIGGYDLISLEGCHFSGDPGRPLLPVKGVHVCVPPGSEIERIEVVGLRTDVLADTYLIYPSQPPLPP